jgi:hypothetical protein
MAEKAVLEKLRYTPGQRAAVLNAPAGYAGIPGAATRLDGTYEFVHVFVTRRAEVADEGARWRAALAPKGIFWASYPKGKAIATDLNRDSLREALQAVGLEAVSQVAIDETWSALRAKPVQTHN